MAALTILIGILCDAGRAAARGLSDVGGGVMALALVVGIVVWLALLPSISRL